jgi:hypothetical protein
LLSGSIRVFSEVDLFAEKRSLSGVPPLALISQFVCHNCPVPGFTDGAGFRFGVDASAVWIRQTLISGVGLGTEASPSACDDVVKTENLDWIFLLDVSLL